MSTGSRRWVYLRETLLALTVVALTFLNFGHTTVSASGYVQVTPDSWCGSPLAPDGVAHSPCHACRADGVALPPPPVETAPVCFAIAPAVYVASIVAPIPPIASRAAQPRGPPILI